MGFKIGDKIVYPNHGVGIVESIGKRTFDGQEMEFYQLRLQENNSTVMVPVQNVWSVGLRKIISRKDARDLMGQIQLAHPELNPRNKDWKNRFKENTEKLKTGQLSDVVDVLVSLTQVNSRKTLSFREKKMYDRAKKLLVSEIAMAEGQPELQVEERIDHALLAIAGCQIYRGV